jgi:hypothetical protein
VTCLGCGGITCQVCEDKSNALTRLSHWPLEVSISRAALVDVQSAIGHYLANYGINMPAATIGELENLANIIRAHLQHEPAPVVKTEEDSSWLG